MASDGFATNDADPTETATAIAARVGLIGKGGGTLRLLAAGITGAVNAGAADVSRYNTGADGGKKAAAAPPIPEKLPGRETLSFG